MVEYVRMVEYNAFHNISRPLIYYIPLQHLTGDEVDTLLAADHRIFDANRYEGDGFSRDYDEPVSKAMKLIKSKTPHIVDNPPPTPYKCAHSVLFMYANLESTE